MTHSPKRLLVLGANGMLGNAVLRWFSQDPSYAVIGAVRRVETVEGLRARAPSASFIPCADAGDLTAMRRLLADVRPDAIINCIGIVKQLAGADAPALTIPINALLPHRLTRLAQNHGARLIHISTDCVFSGAAGNYAESDTPDAADLYGRSKLMGEVDYDNAVTLRTSIIGHELHTSHALLGWFLAQSGPVSGFSNAIFSALPTVELARVIQEFVLPNPGLRGIYHVAGPAISKYDLLQMVARVYERRNVINAEPIPVLDRSLNAGRFKTATGYCSPDWDEMVTRMHGFG
ncbi:MAG: dTDP-4-dehydrorhamnose reductase family protein [Roseateles sp.]|uniref:dTDP-4-dehydrorhamnose reductase family protein n=1 Tax=Roseateles sp. TaxID=1971397 RepID=UPI004036E7C4